MLDYLKNNIIVVIVIVLSFVLGAFCFMISGEDFIKIFSYVAAAYLSIIGIYFIVSAFKYKHYLANNNSKINSQTGYIIQGVFLLGLGVLIIIYPVYLVRIVIGLTLIILPTVQLFFQDDKKGYFIRSLWKYIVGIIFILAIDVIIEIVFLIIGILLFVFASYLIYLLVINYKYVEKPNIITKYFIAYIIKKNNKE